MKSSHADSEDLKMLYQILNPKYIIPVIGEYRHQYVQRNIAIDAGYNKDNIIMLENGEVVTIIDKEIDSIRDHVKTGDILIDGTIIGNMNEFVLKDRENLSSEGAIIVTMSIDKINHKIMSDAYVSSKGFMNEKSELYIELKEAIEEETYRIVKNMLKTRTIDWNQLKSCLRDNIGKIVYDYSYMMPIIIPVIIDVNGDNL